ncbi:MAG: bifunctional 3-deoxy-7-phosphoheptulonate synthase/chorismate mutase type II [Alistipes sp.]|nr:bifunctional 3-deoxy-7-phosphoheptulonate synthase/chorismate mutase type II [Alistipes sp.]
MLDIKSKKPLIISGPCSAETAEQTIQTAQQLAQSGMVDVFRAGVWKPRTKPGMFEGVGIPALPWLVEVKKSTGLPVAIEVANAKHVESALAFGIDMFWIGARTTSNPFSVQEIAEALKGVDIPVLVKNPMNADVELWNGAVERLAKCGVKQLGLIHRGFSGYGSSQYRNTPMWHLAIEIMKRLPELPIFCDPSHICGNTEHLFEISQRAADLNFNGLMLESHITPQKAWSDARQQLAPQDLINMLRAVVWRAEGSDSVAYQHSLDELRGVIDRLDNEIFNLLGKRMEAAENIGRIKRENNVMILQTNRWNQVVERVLARSEELGLSREFLNVLLEAIHLESINKQNNILNQDL